MRLRFLLLALAGVVGGGCDGRIRVSVESQGLPTPTESPAAAEVGTFVDPLEVISREPEKLSLGEAVEILAQVHAARITLGTDEFRRPIADLIPPPTITVDPAFYDLSVEKQLAIVAEVAGCEVGRVGRSWTIYRPGKKP